MPSPDAIAALRFASLIMVIAPALALVFTALPLWLKRKPPERFTTSVVIGSFGFAAFTAIAAAITLLANGSPVVATAFGTWFESSHYRVGLGLSLDALSAPFAALTLTLTTLVALFARTYMHREPGFHRFHLLLSLFGAGVTTVALADTLDAALLGWELVGLTSVLLIAYFHHREYPVRNGLRAFITYRMCDMGLLLALLGLHHSGVGTAISTLGPAPWPGVAPPASLTAGWIVAACLLLAAMGKSAQAPFGGWLPRAMEGPTPSSALFYGALSVHLGAYLLLRAAPVLAQAPWVSLAVVAVGALTAIHATMAGRVQTDIKSSLAYASMTQVGLIFVEIGLGLYTLALVHIIGHACLRTGQFLRAPSIVHDHHQLEMAFRSHIPATGRHFERFIPERLQAWLYRLSLERTYFDSWLLDYVVGGFARVMRGLDRLERNWEALLSGEDHAVHPAPTANEGWKAAKP